MASEEYTAEQFASLTGVPAGTLRVWESRYGFPVPIRTDNNRKRYDRSHAEQVSAVLEYRRRGLSLPAAIERARNGSAAAPRSIFAALRSARPDLAVRVMPKHLLMALSRAIEDEQAARATGGVMLGSFQHERFYRASERRWRGLARTAEAAVVLADFDALRVVEGGLIEVPLNSAYPLEREWSVVLHSPTACACLSAWEVPAPRAVPDRDRSFELLWSCDPSASQAALAAAAGVLADASPEMAEQLGPTLRAPGSVTPDMRFSDDLTSRAFAYMAAASS